MGNGKSQYQNPSNNQQSYGMIDYIMDIRDHCSHLRQQKHVCVCVCVMGLQKYINRSDCQLATTMSFMDPKISTENHIIMYSP